MLTFTPDELAYLAGQKLGRLATVDPDGRPNVVPVGFRIDPERHTIDIGGHNLAQSKKFRNIRADGRVALVVDDVLPPWRPRGVEVRGVAEALGAGGERFGAGWDTALIRVHPRQIIGWGLDTDAFAPNSRRAPADSDTAAP